MFDAVAERERAALMACWEWADVRSLAAGHEATLETMKLRERSKNVPLTYQFARAHYTISSGTDRQGVSNMEGAAAFQGGFDGYFRGGGFAQVDSLR